MIRLGIFEQYQRPSLLGRINPVVKLLVTVVIMLLVSVIFDHQTLVAIIVLGLFLVPAVRVGPGNLIRSLLPFFLFGLGFIWMNTLLPRAGATLLLQLGPLSLYREGLANGISFALRALAFGLWSILFVASTEPVWFILSLVHQLAVPPRLAYSALAAYRYMPGLQQELNQIRGAHRLRGLGERAGLRGKIRRAYRYTVPLLAGALRRASRVAVAMEARAFSGRGRSWYRRPVLQWTDALYALGILGAMAVILYWSLYSGSLRIWSGHL